VAIFLASLVKPKLNRQNAASFGWNLPELVRRKRLFFLDAQPLVQEMIAAIAGFLDEWIPRYQDFQRSYLTVAIGCTGGMHRSVYVAEALAKRLEEKYGPIRTQHDELR